MKLFNTFMRLPISVNQLKNKLIQENLISAEKFDSLLEESERKNENLIDRLIYGYVIDFLDFRIWPVFNLADFAVTAGAILLLVWLWK